MGAYAKYRWVTDYRLFYIDSYPLLSIHHFVIISGLLFADDCK